MSGSYKTIRVEKEEELLWIVLNRPDKLNAINDIMMDEISDALDIAEKDSSIRAVAITGEGRAFSVGFDVTSFLGVTPESAEDFIRKNQHRVFLKIENLSKPAIAAINGYALGAGLELALACDFRVAAENAEFGVPEISFGIVPGWGGTYRLIRTVGLAKAKEISMLGERFDAKKAFEIGLVHRVVPQSKLHDETRVISKKISEKPPTAIKLLKQSLNFGSQVPFEIAFRLDAALMGLTFSTEELVNAVSAFLSRKKTEIK